MWMEIPYPNRGFKTHKEYQTLNIDFGSSLQFELRYGNNLCPPMDEQIKKTQCMSMYHVIFSHERMNSCHSDNLDEAWGIMLNGKSDKDKYYVISHMLGSKVKLKEA